MNVPVLALGPEDEHEQEHEYDGDRAAFRTAVLEGLSRPSRAIPARFLYDEAGSALFDAICELPEYYLTRTETSILRDRASSNAKERAVQELIDELFGYIHQRRLLAQKSWWITGEAILQRDLKALLGKYQRRDVALSWGDVIGDLNRRRGQITGMEDSPSGKSILALVPLSEMFGYATTVRSMSQGRATFTMEFEKYMEVPPNIAESIIKN